MDSKELQQLLISAAERYYDYLGEKGSGRSEISVYEKRSTRKQGTWSLKLASRLFDLEVITFEFPRTGETYDTETIKVVEYDFDNRILLVRPSKNCKINFTSLKPEDIIIVSDLKFLVERLRDYFKQKGKNLKIPTNVPDKKFDASKFDFLPDNYPSDSQKDALDTIFHYPLSYIWGAPGTGKTRFVLANALLKYIREKKRIGIFAPTNVALEQVLSGIIDFTDKAGIDRKSILRIGNPSRNFANEYPEVCEVAGVEKQIREIRKQIEILKGILGIDDLALDQKTIENISNWLKRKSALDKETEKLSSQIQRLETEKRRTNERVIHSKESIAGKRSLIREYERKSKSIWGGILHVIASRYDFETRILRTKNEIEELENQLSNYEITKDQISDKLDPMKKEFDRNEDELNDIRKYISSVSFHLDELQSIWGKGTDIDQRLQELKATMVELSDNAENASMLEAEYTVYPPEVLQAKLEKYLEQLTFLEGQSTEERIKDVYVVGATLDGFVGRFEKEDINFAHVFIDEAAYCNVAKSLVVFTLDAPVTFLGDHLQLPPVIEMNTWELKEENETCFPFLQSSLHSESFFHEDKKQLLQNLIFNKVPVFKETIKVDLNETHRFGENLARVLNQYVYNNGFKGKSRNEQTEILFVHADKIKGQKRRENPTEVEIIQQYLSQEQPEDFAILTPYNSQVSLLGKSLPKERHNQRIMTVHKSQGREWDTVILSVSDTHDMWFTDTTNQKSNALNLINTAVSRAKKQLVIVCDTKFWRTQPDQLIYGLISIGSEYTN